MDDVGIFCSERFLTPRHSLHPWRLVDCHVFFLWIFYFVYCGKVKDSTSTATRIMSRLLVISASSSSSLSLDSNGEWRRRFLMERNYNYSQSEYGNGLKKERRCEIGRRKNFAKRFPPTCRRRRRLLLYIRLVLLDFLIVWFDFLLEWESWFFGGPWDECQCSMSVPFQYQCFPSGFDEYCCCCWG